MAEVSSDRPKADQKVALVTGAAPGGIGGALAEQLHAAGYFVICAVRRPSASASLVRPGIILVELDVSKTESVEGAAHLVSSTTGGRLDVLVNNAGAAHHRPILDIDVDGAAANMFNVNVLGPMRMTKAFADLLIDSKGLIVNIGSVAPLAPMVYSSAYNMTKAALHSYGDSLAMEMEPFGVSVVTVITGGVKSNIVKEDNPRLPTDSLFLPVEKFWQQRVTQSQSGSMDTTVYAKKVVGMIVKKNRPLWFWAGHKSFTVWLTYYLLPTWLRVRIMAKSYGGLHLLKAWWLKNQAKPKSS